MIVLVGNARIAGLRSDVLSDLQSFAAEFKAKTGQALKVTSGYRSPEEQARLYAADPKKAAAPGQSMHNYGYAVDADSTQLDAADRLGLLRKYRFHRPVRGERWHMERIGLVYKAVRAGATVAGLVALLAVWWLLSRSR